MKNKIAVLIASGFGSGYAPFASGTFGSLAALLIYWLIFPKSAVLFWCIAAVLTVLSVPVSTVAEHVYGEKDDGRVVIDEFVGMWISLALLPFSFKIMIASFLLFRVYDVIKPFFVRKVQVWPGGWGIVADDVFAGIFANVTVQAIRLFLPL